MAGSDELEWSMDHWSLEGASHLPEHDRQFKKKKVDGDVALHGQSNLGHSTFRLGPAGSLKLVSFEEVLRAYVADDHKDWDRHLACAEFAINNAWQESIQNTPFFKLRR